MTCLAKAVYFEARGESIKGQYAIAKTVLNRTMNPSFPSTICKVIYQPGQFHGILRLRVKDKQSWDKAMNIAYDVVNTGADFSFKALYFHATHVNPNWKRKRIARIDNHIFYI